MRKQILLLIFTLGLYSNAHSQIFETGEVSVAELEETVHPIDSSAVAAILFKKSKVTFEYSQFDGLHLLSIVKVRIKIYKAEGLEWANLTVPYYTIIGASEEVQFYNVATYNLVDGKIEKTKIKSEGRFDEKINKYVAVRKITLPNVRVGSVIEYEYTIKSPDSGMRRFDFQTTIPTNFVELKTLIPEYFSYNVQQRGYFFPKVQKDSQLQSIFPGRGVGDFLENRTTYTATNVPALKKEAFVNNIDNYTASVSHELAMVAIPGTIVKSFSSDWRSVAETIYGFTDFGGELGKTGYFEDDINALVAGRTDIYEKIALIFNHVKSTVKWNNREGFTANMGVKTAYREHIGNVAEINLMLTSMLRHVGIDANPVLVSTRDNGIAMFPNINAFNYVISAVETPQGMILLDATEKYSQPNVLPLRVLNWMGRLVRKDGSSVAIDLIPHTLSKNITSVMLSVETDGTLRGKVRTMLSDNNALEFRQKYVDANAEMYLEQLENQYGTIEISEYSRLNDHNIGESLVESYSFIDRNSAEIIGDRMYLAPSLFLGMSSNPFQQQVREYPVDFRWPQQKRLIININVPEGYTVESLPPPLKLAMEDEVMTFRFNIAETDRKIQININSDINTALFPAVNYQSLKEFYNKMVEKHTEKIIFKKI